MTYIQKDLTTTPYEIPGISWELTESLLEKFRTHKGLSKLVFSDDGTQLMDITEDSDKKARVQQIKEARAAQEAQRQLARKKYLPTAGRSVNILAQMLVAQVLPQADETQTLQLSGLFLAWAPERAYPVGDVCNANDQTWECYAALDPERNPGVTPDTPAWYNFFRPLHGKTSDTARRFVAVHGAHDMYLSGEYMVWTDGMRYRCKRDTSFGPADDAQAWEAVQDG